MLRTILCSVVCASLSAILLSGCKEKKKSEVVDTEAKTQFGRAVGSAESLRNEMNRKSDQMNDEMNGISVDE